MPPRHPEVISPELVLVDPALAVRARELLADREPALAPRERPSPDGARSSSTHANGVSAFPLDDATAAAFRRLAARSLPAPGSEELRAPRTRRPRRLALLIAASCAALSSVLILVGVVLGGDAPATVESPAPTRPALRELGAGSEKPKPESVPVRPARGPAPTPPARSGSSAASRRLAWAPTAGASGYHVELFRGTSRVFAADTTRPGITIPAKWTFDRHRYRLEAVAYGWYVWPIVAGTRSTTATVQATLVVRDR